MGLKKKKASSFKRPTSLVRVQERCILTQSDYSLIWPMFSGGHFAMCSKYALKCDHPLTHNSFWGFSLRKRSPICAKLYLQ